MRGVRGKSTFIVVTTLPNSPYVAQKAMRISPVALWIGSNLIAPFA
jgi:hypothetical protein